MPDADLAIRREGPPALDCETNHLRADVLNVLARPVRVRRLGERRRDFLRRWRFRGMDELRRQQANAPAPRIGGCLDESV